MTLSTHTKEAIKTFGRMILLSVLPVVIASLQDGKGLRDTAVAVGISLLAAVDSWIHNNENISANGLVPF